MRRMCRSRKRTVSGHPRRSAAVLFLVGLTVLFFALRGSGLSQQEASYESGYTIMRESLAGREEVPLEEYLIGALAASVPDGFEPEACKAQAVILRTNVERLVNETGDTAVVWEALCQESLTKEEMYGRWETDYEKKYETLKAAVEETAGQTFCYNGVAVELPFFPVSAGQTRNPQEEGQRSEFPYLESVVCGEDVFALDYRKEIRMSEREWHREMQRIFETDEKIDWEEIEFKVDGAGYVTQAIWNEKAVSGEFFRKELSLASAHFEIKTEEHQILIVTKGEGHGLGMSLYTANAMAGGGSDYREILHYFFPGCEIVKN